MKLQPDTSVLEIINLLINLIVLCLKYIFAS